MTKKEYEQIRRLIDLWYKEANNYYEPDLIKLVCANQLSDLMKPIFKRNKKHWNLSHREV
jgi:hypothetical protein